MHPSSTLEKVALSKYEQYTKAILPKDYLTICVMGSTGVGKSSFLNFLARPEGPPVFESVRSLASVTQSTSEYEYDHESFLWLFQDKINSYPIRLVDAPGLNDTQDRGIDLQHVSNLIDEVKKHKKIDTLVFVVKITDRFDSQFMHTLKYCCNDLFGNVPEHFIKIVFTYLDSDMYEEYQDDQGGEKAYAEKLDEIYSFFAPHLGNKTMKCYFINTARKNPGRVNEALKKYYDFCRNYSSLTPGMESIFEFHLEDVDVYSLYVRDKIIHDIYTDSTGYNWKKSTVSLPPSVINQCNTALVALYTRKEQIVEHSTVAQELNATIDDLIQRKNRIADSIYRLRNDHMDLGVLHEKIYPGSSSTFEISWTTPHDLISWQDFSDGVNIQTPISNRKGEILTYKVTTQRTALLWGHLRVKFTVFGAVRHATEIAQLRRDKHELRRQIREKKVQLRASIREAAELNAINKKISLLKREQHKMDRLEDVFKYI